MLKADNSLFSSQLEFNIEQLKYRFEKLSKIDTTKKENQKEYLMIFDSFLALFRALFLEKETNNILYRTILKK